MIFDAPAGDFHDAVLDTAPVADESGAEPVDSPGSAAAPASDLSTTLPPAPAGAENGDAIELDAEDPETQLDLARAYLAMGRKEQARGLLEKVLQHGSAAQLAEAEEMLGEL
jgi:FimV-like protein